MLPRIRTTIAPSTPRTLPGRRRALGAIASGLLAPWLATRSVPAQADAIGIRGADIRIDEGELLLNADFDVALNPTLEEALQRGIPLYFVLDFEILKPRWYWLDEKVVAYATSWRISWAPLTRQYRVATGLLTLTFDTPSEVERLLSRVTSRVVGSADALAKGTRYVAQVRLRLDVNQLPKPFQVDALASREWQLASEWRVWSFTP
jgi:hypothetical protein